MTDWGGAAPRGRQSCEGCVHGWLVCVTYLARARPSRCCHEEGSCEGAAREALASLSSDAAAWCRPVMDDHRCDVMIYMSLLTFLSMYGDRPARRDHRVDLFAADDGTLIATLLLVDED